MLAAVLTQTSNLSIKSNVIEVGLCCLHISLVLLWPIFQRKNLLLTIGSIVIKVQFAVHTVNYKSNINYCRPLSMHITSLARLFLHIVHTDIHIALLSNKHQSFAVKKCIISLSVMFQVLYHTIDQGPYMRLRSYLKSVTKSHRSQTVLLWMHEIHCVVLEQIYFEAAKHFN